MKNEMSDYAYYPESKNNFNIKKFLLRIIRRWPWFALSIFLCVLIAWFYNHYSPSEYSIHSSLIVNEYEAGMKQFNLNQGMNNEANVNVLLQDHPGRIKSHVISLNTLQSLGWNVFWFRKMALYDQDLYSNEPYQMILLSNKNNLTDIPIQIKEISNLEYFVEVESKTTNGKIMTNFSQKGKFGEPFESIYFNFIIERKPGVQPYSKKDIFCIIYNLNNLAKAFQSKIKVIYNEKMPDIMELVLSEQNPKRGVDFLNKLEQTYIDYGLADKNRVAENTIHFIDNQLRNVTDSLSDSESRFTNFRTRTQSMNLSQEGDIVLTKKENLESDKALLENRIQYLKNLRDNMNDTKQMKQVVLPSAFGINDQSLNALVTKLIDLYSKREVLSFSVQEKAPSFIALNREIETTHDNLTRNISAFLAATQNDLNSLNRRMGGTSNQLSLLPRTEQQLISLKRSFDLNNELYTYLLKMRAESAITYASNQPDVKVLDPARIETAKQIRPMTMINYLIGLIIGFIIPVSFIWGNDFFRGSIQSKDEVEDLTKLPIVGMITHNKTKKDWVVLDNPRSSITESFRLLRTNLKFMLNEKNKKVIAVQSSVPGEGKTFISSNLASVLAMNNLKVLLVGVDMRRSKLNQIFQNDNKKGLSTFLSNQDSFQEVIMNTSISNLKFVPSGPIPPNPAELLENGNFDLFMKEAKIDFDYIILDSPPVSLVADGIITGQKADINLFVLRFRFSGKEQIKFFKSIENLPSMAIVLNDAIKENYSDGNYYSKTNNYYQEQ